MCFFDKMVPKDVSYQISSLHHLLIFFADSLCTSVWGYFFLYPNNGCFIFENNIRAKSNLTNCWLFYLGDNQSSFDINRKIFIAVYMFIKTILESNFRKHIHLCLHLLFIFIHFKLWHIWLIFNCSINDHPSYIIYMFIHFLFPFIFSHHS